MLFRSSVGPQGTDSSTHNGAATWPAGYAATWPAAVLVATPAPARPPVYRAADRPTEALITPTTWPRWWVKFRTLVTSATARQAWHGPQSARSVAQALWAPAASSPKPPEGDASPAHSGAQGLVLVLAACGPPVSKNVPPLQATTPSRTICQKLAW